ncbi:MAG: DUF1559 domain-containing protein [Planctomycetes bacterium]|nr:DUF1559 domain-containing protein [Planctomycetota bacterium]
MLVFECPSCKGKMQAADEYAGQTVACPECGATTTVPRATAAPEAFTAQPTASPAAPTDAITTPDQTRAASRAADPDFLRDDRPGRRIRSDGTTAAAATAVGMSVGVIVLIVVGVIGCVVISIGVILTALLVPAVSKVREAAARAQTINDMKQVVLATHNYHDNFKRLPTPKMEAFPNELGFQKEGPKQVDLSWRVAILPWIDQQPMFMQFDKTNDWNHANNARFANSRPPVYDDVNLPIADPTHTRHQYFTGKNTLWTEERKRVTFMTMTDGPSNTILIAQSNNPVTWSKGADMAITPQGELPLPPNLFMAAMGDGSVRMIDRRKVNDQILRMAIDPNDGQVLPAAWND